LAKTIGEQMAFMTQNTGFLRKRNWFSKQRLFFHQKCVKIAATCVQNIT
jgi:hypothetical protein